DLAFELIVGQRENRNRALGDEIAGKALDRQRDDFLALANRLFLSFLLDHANALGRFELGLFDHLIDQVSLCLLASQPGDLLELLSRFVHVAVALGRLVFNVALARFQALFAFYQLALLLVQRLQAFVQSFLFADQAPFLILQLAARLAHLFLELGAFLEHAVFGVKLGLLFNRRRILFGLFENARGGVVRRLGFRLRLLVAQPDDGRRQ